MKKITAVLFGLILMLPIGARAISSTVILELINTERRNIGLAPLQINAKLQSVAQKKASDMALRNYFEHNSPEGTTPWDLFAQAGYKFATAGENLAVNSLNFSESAIVQGWMNSPGHRAIILDGRHTETGIGIADGMYQGLKAVYVAEEFGSPLTTPEVQVVVLPPVQLPTQPKIVTPVVIPATPVGIAKTVAKTLAKNVVQTIAPKVEAKEAGETITGAAVVSVATSTTEVHSMAEVIKLSWFARFKLFLSHIFTFSLG